MSNEKEVNKQSASDEEIRNAFVDLAVRHEKAIKRVREIDALLDGGQVVGKADSIVALAAKVAHEVNRAYCKAIGDDSQLPWHEASASQQNSCVVGVRAIVDDPNLSPEASHALWCRYKKEAGWIFGDTKDEEAKTHPCLVPYSDLPREQQIKDSLFGATARAVLGIING